MTTLEAEIKLLEYFDIKKNIIVPNVTRRSGLVSFECDMLILSKSNYATNIEIKVTAADLKNDKKKKHICAIDTRSFKRYYKPIKYFYYAVPSKIIDKALKQIPEFAGLINLDTMKIVKKPEMLFKTKWSEKELDKLKRLGTMRVLTLKKNIFKLKNKKC